MFSQTFTLAFLFIQLLSLKKDDEEHMAKVTFKDVARLAGVSTQTVSRVTQQAASVSDETRKKVQAAIDQLGYVPSKSAQLLKSRQSRLIGLISLELTFFGAAMVAAGIRRAAQAQGYHIALAVNDDASFEGVKRAIQEFRAQQVEAIIINLPLSQQQALDLAHSYRTLPLVFTDTYATNGIITVMSNHYSGAQQTITHLIAQGRQHFLLLQGVENSPASQGRLQGWLDTLAQHNITPIAQAAADWCATIAYEQIVTALQQKLTIDAIVCANDQMALGAMKALHDHGIAIPQQIAVTGFDDTPDSTLYFPALTTVRQDFSAIGHSAMEAVLYQLKHSNAEHAFAPIIVPVQLIERESSVR